MKLNNPVAKKSIIFLQKAGSKRSTVSKFKVNNSAIKVIRIALLSI